LKGKNWQKEKKKEREKAYLLWGKCTKNRVVFCNYIRNAQGGIDREKICCYPFIVLSGNVSRNVLRRSLNKR